MQEVFQRVAKWNAARYEQEYNHELAVKLLREEYREWIEADNLTDQVHELCDVIFVAMGAMWKYGKEMTDEQQAEWFTLAAGIADAHEDPAMLVSIAIDCIERDGIAGKDRVLNNLFSIVLYAQAQLFSNGLDFDQTVACMNILCDSNDSKKIKKTASDVKANDNDKGVYYKSPVPKIKAIVEHLYA